MARPSAGVIQEHELPVDVDKLQRAGQFGWLAKGIIYLLMGILTVRLAFGSSAGQEADPMGALEGVASQPFGRILLFILAAGLLLYAGWRVLTALLPGEGGVHGLAARAGYFFSAALYAVLGHTALVMAANGDTEASDSTTPLLRQLLDTGWGRWIVGLIGLIALGSAAYFVYKGIDRRFEDQIDYSEMSEMRTEVVRRLGQAGWVGRSIVVALLGVFLTHAAVTYNVEHAKGLDGVLREVSTTWWGTGLVVVAGLGLVVYALFCLSSWRQRRLVGP